jgi:predicted AlkP superfamily pyrophosphatase or phosphodiesterase
MISVDGLAGFYFDDPKAEMPTIRALAAEGARASSMKASTPTVTWPNHTTLVTGMNPARHGVVGNNYYDRATRKKVTLISDPVYDKEQIVKTPTLYDLAKGAGMKTAAIRWPASRNAKTLDWAIPDVATKELLLKYSTPTLLPEAKQAGIAAFDADKPTDEQSTRLFNLILREHRPNLALLHLIEVDHTQHMSGPRSPEAYAAVKEADELVRQVWDEAKHDFPGKATLFIVSDHGFSPIKRVLLPNVVLRKAGLVKTEGKKEVASESSAVQVVPQGGAALLYVMDEARRGEIVAQIKNAFAGVAGVAKVVGPDELKNYGVANPKDDPHAPDMILFGEMGCTFGDTAAGELPFNEKPERKGSHGHDPSLPDLHATFVAWGAGIKKGARMGEISNTSVAPTIARLMGLTIPNPDGTVLSAALSD